MKGVLFLLIVITIDRIAIKDELTTIEGSENNGSANLIGLLLFKMKEDGIEFRWIRETVFLY